MSKCKEMDIGIVNAVEETADEKNCCCKDKKKKKKCCKCKSSGYEVLVKFMTHKGGSLKISLKITPGMIFAVFLSLAGFIALTKRFKPECRELVDIQEGIITSSDD